MPFVVQRLSDGQFYSSRSWWGTDEQRWKPELERAIVFKRLCDASNSHPVQAAKEPGAKFQCRVRSVKLTVEG